MTLQSSESLWEKAVEGLNDEDKQNIDFGRSNKLAILDDVLAAVEKKKQFRMGKRWTFTKGGKQIVIRDLLEKVVVWVNKFKEVGDAAVQYDPGHASLPWAGVRFLLQVTVNDSETFGAMAEGIQFVSNLITRLAILESIYLRTNVATAAKDQLVESVVKLYTATLRYLAKARQYYDRSVTKNIGRSVIKTSQTSVDVYLSKISEEQVNVDACIRLVDAHWNENMREEVDRLQTILSQLQDPINRSATQLSDLHTFSEKTQRGELMKWISTMPHLSHHKAIGKDFLQGSGMWLLHKEEFVEWRKSSSSSILWLHGIPGSGKSKLVYSVIEYLVNGDPTNKAPAPIAYFYCARNESEPERANPDEIMRSIVKQLSCQKSDLRVRQPLAKIYVEKKQEAEDNGCEPEKLTIVECTDCILALLESNPATIIVDALDECDPARRGELLNILDKIIQRSANLVKVFVSSRDDIDIVLHLTNSPNMFIQASDNSKDIERFVRTEIAQSVKEKKLLRGQNLGELENRIIETLIKGAQGMFRWVSLQIQNLCDSTRMKLKEDIERELGRLPTSLKESYDVIYKRISDSGPESKSVAKRAMNWLLCAHRSLRTSEFIAAVSVDSEGNYVSLTNEDLLSICCNLLVLDAELNVFRFAHLSVQEYLNGLPDHGVNERNVLALERSLQVFQINPKTGHPSIDQHNLLRTYATLYWPIHYQNLDTQQRKQSLKSNVNNFLFQGSCVSSSFTEWARALKEEAYEILDWKDPLKGRLFDVSNSPSKPLIVACIFGFPEILEELDIEKLNWNEEGINGQTPLSLAAKQGHETVVKLLLNTGKVDVDSKDKNSQTPLLWAMKKGHEAIVKLLLDTGKVDVNSKNENGQTPLSWAAEKRHETIVKLLLNIGKVDVDSKDENGRTPLSWAAIQRHETVVKLLLNTGRVDVDSKDENGRTPLSWAAIQRHETVVKLLLNTGKVDVDSKDENGRTPLSWAAIQRHETVVKLLLNTGKVDVDFKDKKSLTPLLWAIKKEHEAIMKLLLNTGKIDPNSKDENGQTPLSWAAKKGHETIMKLLLNIGKVDVNSKDENGLTPLLWAMKKGHEAVVKLLLNTGKVDVDFKDKNGRTPLSWATGKGHETIVKLLLNTEKVDVDSKDKYHQTPLLWAAAQGHEAVMKLLLNTGKVDVNSESKNSLTPLSSAAIRGHEAVVKLLLNIGKVDVDFKDKNNLTPLIWAAGKGHEAIVKLLLNTGKVDVDYEDEKDQTPLSWAAKNGHELVVKLLLNTGKVDVDSKDKKSLTPLLWAMKKGHEAIVKLLLNTGKVDVDSKDSEYGQTPLSWAAEVGHETIVKLLLDTGKVDVNSKDENGRTPLSWAARNKCEAIVKLLLDTEKVDVDSKDKNGRTPLSWAAKMGHETVVKLLLDTGKVDVDSKNKNGQTPLFWAAGKGHETIVKLLLNTGKVDVDYEDENGQTPLLWAAKMGHEAVVRLLLDTGKVDVDFKDSKYGQTPLSWAAEMGHETVVKLLLDAGKVDVDSKDKNGQTPLSWAAEMGHEAVVKLLQSHQCHNLPMG